MKFARIRSAKLLNLGFWLIAIALLINVARVTLPRLKVYAVGLTSHANPSHSYTSILRETVFDPQGRSQPGVTNTWAVRSDGSRVVRFETSRNGQVTMHRAISFASGERVSLDELGHMKSTTTYKDPNADSWIREPESNCLNSVNGRPMEDGEVLSGTDIVKGYQAVKIVKDNLSFWYVPAYGCALVQFEANWEDGARTKQELVSLLPGEPSPALFDLPTGFAEVSPSKMLPSQVTADIAQRLDQKYYAHHVQ